jgi:DMSO/TMAO reductase YedYZ molybdopterin-dependent catalytic subunit
VAAIVAPPASPVFAVGAAFIDVTPEWLKSFAIATFGENDKVVLLAGVAGVLALVAVGIGVLALRHLGVAAGAIAVLGAVGALAALTRPGMGITALVPATAGAGAGIAALVLLVRSVAPRVPSSGASGEPTRRRFLVAAGSVAFLAATTGGLGALLVERRATAAASAQRPLPEPDEPPLPAQPSADLGLTGIAPFFTPNDRFYRVDTALQVPVLAAADWRLRIHGMVDVEVELTFDDLLEYPVVERDITLTCVSNEVGGGLAGNARWTGVRLADVLASAGVRAGADQLVSTSIDGMTIGTPTAVALDGRDALLAIGMNGEPLPAAHGAPVRMVVPGLYGYVSATKWVVDLELTTFDAYDAYWVQRGWAERAEIHTMSRIDTPKPLAQLAPGRHVVGGVAWAQGRGIARVEVRVDEGAWQDADLAPVDTVDTWRQWSLPWEAAAGRHRLAVRATDATGAVQVEERATPFPKGATGWHTVLVAVA